MLHRFLGILCFNSNLVQLKEFDSKTAPGTGGSFNSNLVQLKVDFVPGFALIGYCFNSNLVQLKDRVQAVNAAIHRCFNSNLVQLKEYKEKMLLGFANKFQFQSGAIKGMQFLQSQQFPLWPKLLILNGLLRVGTANRQKISIR